MLEAIRADLLFNPLSSNNVKTFEADVDRLFFYICVLYRSFLYMLLADVNTKNIAYNSAQILRILYNFTQFLCLITIDISE